MFEITTRLPNSFAFKNHPKHLLHQNHKYSTIFSTSTNSPPYSRSDVLNRDGMPIYFGHTSSSINNTSQLSSFSNAYHNHPTMSSSFTNPRVNSSPFIYDYSPTTQTTMSATELKKPEQPISNNSNNITILPVYYNNEDTHLPSLRSSSTKSASHVNKIQVTGSQVLPTIRNSSNLGTQSYVHIHSHDPTSSFVHRSRPSNSTEQINLTQRAANSLNMSRIHKLADGNRVIYNHESEYLPTLSSSSSSSSSALNENVNKISVIKSIKARQDMFLSKLKANTDEEEENSQRLKYHFEDAKKSKIEDENEMNLIRRNFSYLFVNNNNVGKASGSGGQGLSQAEVNYRNTLNNTEKRLKSLREYQNNMDRLRMEANDTPI